MAVGSRLCPLDQHLRVRACCGWASPPPRSASRDTMAVPGCAAAAREGGCARGCPRGWCGRIRERANCMLAMKRLGKPDTGNPFVRFDEGRSGSAALTTTVSSFRLLPLRLLYLDPSPHGSTPRFDRSPRAARDGQGSSAARAVVAAAVRRRMGPGLAVPITSLRRLLGRISFYRCTRAPPPFINFSTSPWSAMLVSPGVVIASAPWAAPYSTAFCASPVVISP